jgi:RES domain-containing protein
LHPLEELIPVLENAKLSSFSGFTFRLIADRWRASPLSAIGALHRGGRYNPPGEFAVLYTADSQLTALREVEALFLDADGELRGVPRNPDLILTLECSLVSVLDLTEAAILEQLGMSYEELVAESPSRFIENARGRKTPTQNLGLACSAAATFRRSRFQARRILQVFASTFSLNACLKVNSFVYEMTRGYCVRNCLGKFHACKQVGFVCAFALYTVCRH